MTRPDRRAITAVSLALAVTLTGCTAATPPPAITPTATTPSPRSTAARDALAAAAVEVAVAAMTAYLDRQSDEDAWWGKLSPFLSAEAAYFVEGTDQAQIPATTITGDPIPTVSSDTFVSVLVPTDAGGYRLDMIPRGDTAADGTWIVFALTPPEGTR